MTLACASAAAGWAANSKVAPADRVRFLRAPDAGLQPQLAVAARGAVHLVYYKGDPRAGDLFYARSEDAGATFSAPLAVNSQAGSAIAAGTIRGAQLALGKANAVHIAWNGSGQGEPKGPVNPDSNKAGSPMLYSRLGENGRAFEPQRNLMLHSFGLDGGGSVAADPSGNVYVAWHGIGLADASSKTASGEARRRLWIAKSADGGRSFAPEEKAWPQPTGACGCCGMKIFAGREGRVTALYRSATESVHRDIYLLDSHDRGRTFEGSLLHRWEINACPMSSMDIAESSRARFAAWETGGQVYWAPLAAGGSRAGAPVAAPGEGKGRKHPRLAVNPQGEVLLVWTQGTGWAKGGSLAWRIFRPSGEPTPEAGQLPGIPAWSFAAAMVRPDGGFAIMY